MVYKYRSVKCPNCGKTADRNVRKEYQDLSGSPFRVCVNCKKVYFDGAYQEPALLKFKDDGTEINTWAGLGGIIFSVLTIWLLYEFIKNRGEDIGTTGYFVFGMFAILAIVFDSGIVKAIFHRIHPNEYHMAQIEYLEGRKGKVTQDDKASMERLSNKTYLDALKAHGIDIPEYFYQRLNK